MPVYPRGVWQEGCRYTHVRLDTGKEVTHVRLDTGKEVTHVVYREEGVVGTWCTGKRV